MTHDDTSPPCRLLVSILNWNNAPATIGCLRALHASDMTGFHVLVIDNGSADDSAARIRAAYPDVEVLALEQNWGYAGGHRHALAVAAARGCAWLLVLNNDAQVQPDTLSQLMAAQQQLGTAIYGAVPIHAEQGQPLKQRRVRFHHKFLRLPYRERLFDWRPQRLHAALFRDAAPQSVAAVSGSAMMLPLALIARHGFMDEDFFMYSEEIDYCFKLRAAGVPLYMVPQAFVVHAGAGSTRSNPALRNVARYYRTRNQLVRLQRHQNRRHVLAAVCKNALLLAYQLVRGRPHAARYLLRGTADGLRQHLGKRYAPEDHI